MLITSILKEKIDTLIIAYSFVVTLLEIVSEVFISVLSGGLVSEKGLISFISLGIETCDKGIDSAGSLVFGDKGKERVFLPVEKVILSMGIVVSTKELLVNLVFDYINFEDCKV